MKFLVSICVVVCAFHSPNISSGPMPRYMRPDLENIPVERLIENLTDKIDSDRDNSQLHMNLARVYGMAFAKKQDELQVNNRNPDKPWFGYAPPHIPFGEIKDAENDETKTKAKKNLEMAINHFERAIEIDAKNLTAKLGLAWSMDQLSENMTSIDIYREIIEAGWKEEKDKKTAGLGFHSIVEEAAGYLMPKLDHENDAEEIKSLEEKIAKVKKIQRPITPIAIPLGKLTDFESVIDRDLNVAFDLDGSGLQKRWEWISKDSGWLVFDRNGEGKIGSGLQLFGNVAFWCFWEDGYQALGSLDNNGDGQLSGAELTHLAIWRDLNSNGVSDSGEVRSLAGYQIVALKCDSQILGSNISNQPVQYSERGVVFANGDTRPSYDVVLVEKSGSQRLAK